MELVANGTRFSQTEIPKRNFPNFFVNENAHSHITYPVKTDFFTGKMIVTVSKEYFGIMVPQLDGATTFVAKRQRI